MTLIFNSGPCLLIILEMVLHLHLSPAGFDYTDCVEAQKVRADLAEVTKEFPESTVASMVLEWRRLG